MYYSLLENFNNYYNRIYKSFDTLLEYTAYQEENNKGILTVTNKSTNFNTNDGIDMVHVMNIDLSTISPNYLLLIEENDSSIASRWFILDCVRLRGNQYELHCRRDVISDYYDSISKAPLFVEKGYVANTDPAIFNKENMGFNQIKRSETLLRDDSNTAWIVGYVAQDHSAISNETFTVNPEVDMVVSGNISDWSYYDLLSGEHLTINPNDSSQYVKFWLYFNNGWTEKNKCYSFNGNTYDTYLENSRRDHFQLTKDDYDSISNSNAWYSAINWNTCIEKVLLDNPSWVDKSRYDYLMSLVGKKIQFDNGIYEISLAGSYDSLGDTKWQDSGNLYTYIYGVVNTLATNGIQSVAYYPVSYKMSLKHFTFTYTQVTDIKGTYKYSIPQTVKKLNDAPYKMFAIPYYTGDKYYVFSLDGSNLTRIEPDLMMSWAMAIATKLDSNLYDLQLLPYCPLSMWRGLRSSTKDGIWSIDKTINEDYTTLLDNNDNVVGYCSWCDVSSKEDYLSNVQVIVSNPKIENECYNWRLCSPNYASAFEFNAAKNGGVEGFNVRFTYKPFQPFINVAPKFNLLYGEDFKDNRGLILSGDFSLPIVKDSWVSYQLNNKNYMLTFDREIESMEINNNIARQQDYANAIAGTIQGTISGAMAGGMWGGLGGAIVGGVAGAGASLVGGVMDIKNNELLRQEAIDFKRDQFGYQLGNIQALPRTLNKVSSIISISKLFPFLEFYSCTDEEIKALEDKIKYNGMTIMRIGKLEDYINPNDTTYIKGKLIRLEIDDDYHITNEIANELDKGVYI